MSTQEKTGLDTQGVANRLTELCRAGKYTEAEKELLAQDAVCIEPEYTQRPVIKGLKGIIAKGEEFQKGVAEFHGGTVSDPIIAGNYFTLSIGMDATMKEGKRMNMEEVAVYKVENGKIVSQQFFY